MFPSWIMLWIFRSGSIRVCVLRLCPGRVKKNDDYLLPVPCQGICRVSGWGLSWDCFLVQGRRKIGPAGGGGGTLFIPAGEDKFLGKGPRLVLCELAKMTGDQILGQRYGGQLCLTPGRCRDDFLAAKSNAADSFFSIPPRCKRQSRPTIRDRLFAGWLIVFR